MTDDELNQWLFDRREVRLPDGELTEKMIDAVRAVLQIHVPQKIYDECEHEHGYDDPALIDTGDFTTCQDGYMYSICRACCTTGWDHEQTEDCASDHKHGPDRPICLTVGTMAAALGILTVSAI